MHTSSVGLLILAVPLVALCSLGYGSHRIRKDKSSVLGVVSLAVGAALSLWFFEGWAYKQFHLLFGIYYIIPPLLLYFTPFILLARHKVSNVAFFTAFIAGLFVTFLLGIYGGLMVSCAMGDCL